MIPHTISGIWHDQDPMDYTLLAIKPNGDARVQSQENKHILILKKGHWWEIQ